MCGIFGARARRKGAAAGGVAGGAGAQAVSPEALAAMARALAHRGPDGAAFVEKPWFSLGMARLGIVAPEEGPRVHEAHAAASRQQRKHRHQGRDAAHTGAADPRIRGCVAVHNGEVDNHVALRADAARHGVAVDGRADSAVIPALYLAHGSAAFAQLRGPGAIALVDDDGALHLVRDPLGKKPLFVAQTAERVVFASEQKALVAAGAASASKVSSTAAAFFLAHGVLPDHMPILEGVEAVAPGEEWIVDDDGVRRVARRAFSGTDKSEKKAAADAAVADLVDEAVARRVPRDVKGAVALSGGIDSAIVAALARRGGVDVAYTLAMAGHDESEGARATSSIVEALAARGYEHACVAPPAPSVALLRCALRHVEAPDAFSAWGMATSTLALAERVAADGVRVLLSGEGADEIFLGYPWHRVEAAGERGFLLGDDDVVTRYAGPNAVFRYASLRHEMFLHGERPTAMALWLRLQRPQFREVGERAVALLSSSMEVPRWPDRAEAEPHGARGRQRDALGRDMLLLPVLHADRLFMAHGVEVRMPFLDEDLVRHALRLPQALLEDVAREKPRVYALAERIDARLARGKQKRGFVAAARPDDAAIIALATDVVAGGVGVVGGDALLREIEKARAGDPVALEVVWRAVLLEETARALA